MFTWDPAEPQVTLLAPAPSPTLVSTPTPIPAPAPPSPQLKDQLPQFSASFPDGPNRPIETIPTIITVSSGRHGQEAVCVLSGGSRRDLQYYIGADAGKEK
ncbi:hypothetical protein NA57DRAFT_53265 [Rhizodiscina lignyota]|uniref:Uncharacterized protein n=1 Tax=Rhizodiscina lignyota TaxID=1504668 RepID=A0A9P4MD46_9PEZI|nr:hypothetical protein NA57DRAFT_53265 [Rhizodiscina lignyota]